MDSTLYEPVNIGNVPSLEIESALATLDSDRVWQAAQPGYPMEDFYEAVKEHTFNKTTTLFKGSAIAGIYNSTLMVLPVIVYPNQNRNQSSGTQISVGQSAQMINRSIAKWASPTAATSVLNGLLSYNQMAANDPVDFRAILNLLSEFHLPQSSSASKERRIDIPLSEEEAVLPIGMPMLHFLTASITQKNAFPSLPSTAESGSFDLNSRIQSALQFELGDADSNVVNVLLPEAAELAIETGIKAWLTALNDHYKFEEWDASPGFGDLVQIKIELADSNKTRILIPVRVYQIGTAGLERVLGHVAKLTERVQTRNLAN